MAHGTKTLRGCFIAAVLALLMVIIMVGAIFAILTGRGGIPSATPIPDDVPPAGGANPPAIDTDAPGRTSLQLAEWAAPIAEETGISPAALMAYGNAQVLANKAWPDCHLNWTTLAGIGYVETRHGTYTSKLLGHKPSIDDNGFVNPIIVGVPLDGSPGFAEIRDTDQGTWDGDAEYDRAVGPMQFIPETFRTIGIDANGDGVPNPNQIDDAAASAARYLCLDGRDLATPKGWTRAIYAYNNSSDYLVKVRNAAAHYALGQKP